MPFVGRKEGGRKVEVEIVEVVEVVEVVDVVDVVEVFDSLNNIGLRDANSASKNVFQRTLKGFSTFD